MTDPTLQHFLRRSSAFCALQNPEFPGSELGVPKWGRIYFNWILTRFLPDSTLRGYGLHPPKDMISRDFDRILTEP